MMVPRKTWINIAIVNLCIVALLGLTMRSKALFDMPWIDYNRLVDTHGNFAFNGWLTLVLLSLFIFELPGALRYKSIYHSLLGGIALCSWGTLLTSPFELTHTVAEYISFVFIL